LETIGVASPVDWPTLAQNLQSRSLDSKPISWFFRQSIDRVVPRSNNTKCTRLSARGLRRSALHTLVADAKLAVKFSGKDQANWHVGR
jgi:hypothetical protein